MDKATGDIIVRVPGKFSGENLKRHTCEGGVRFAHPAPASLLPAIGTGRKRPLETLRFVPHPSWVMRCCYRLPSGRQCPKRIAKCQAGALTKTMAKAALLEVALASGWRQKSGAVWRALKWLCPVHAPEVHGESARRMVAARRERQDG